MKDAVDWLSDEGDGNALNVGWFNEMEFLDNAPDDFRRDCEVVLIIPGLLLIDKWARDIASMSVL